MPPSSSQTVVSVVASLLQMFAPRIPTSQYLCACVVDVSLCLCIFLSELKCNNVKTRCAHVQNESEFHVSYCKLIQIS